MDRLAKNAMLAKQAGLSYGRWKAMQPRVEVDTEKTEGWTVCEWKRCGKAFPPKHGKKFCDAYCRQEAYKERKYAERKGSR